jgi:Asp-tRNA(Asn)/Glu-tRNA(Gln) amidotransferase A subunit family amidase
MGAKLTSACSYLFIANLLQWPSGVVPVTLVQENEEDYDWQRIPENQQDAIARLANKVMEKSAGLPISVSIMTPKFRDETCLRVMREVESATQFKAKAKAYLEATSE